MQYDMQWVQGDALQLPFEAASFDAATMGYGLRNVASIPRALQVIHTLLCICMAQLVCGGLGCLARLLAIRWPVNVWFVAQCLMHHGLVYPGLDLSQLARCLLQELHRVLKPGATVAVLDFNNVQNPLVDSFQVRHTYIYARNISTIMETHKRLPHLSSLVSNVSMPCGVGLGHAHCRSRLVLLFLLGCRGLCWRMWWCPGLAPWG